MFGKGLLGAAVVTAIAVATLAASPSLQQVDRGEQILNVSCTGCHDARPIQTQALDKDGWTKVVSAMVEKERRLSPTMYQSS